MISIVIEKFPNKNHLPFLLVVFPRITQSLIDRIEQHLDVILELQDIPLLLQAGERAMLARLRAGYLTKYDIEFYLHELIEAAYFKRIQDLRQAHTKALKFRKITERELFHLDIIHQYPQLFPYHWRD